MTLSLFEFVVIAIVPFVVIAITLIITWFICNKCILGVWFERNLSKKEKPDNIECLVSQINSLLSSIDNRHEPIDNRCINPFEAEDQPREYWTGESYQRIDSFGAVYND